MQIELARTEELEDIAALLADVRQWLIEQGVGEQWPVPLPSSILIQRIEQRQLYVAKSGDVVIGTFTLLWSDPEMWDDVPDDGGYVHTLAAARTQQGQNIGRELLNAAASLARENGCRYLRLDCWAPNQRLCRYYEQVGFQGRGIRTFSNGFSLQRYEREVIRQPLSEQT